MKYGQAIRVARSARGLSQKDLARRIGVDASFISLLESERRQPSIDTLEDISKELRIPMYLIMLLASNKHELRGISEPEAKKLGNELLQTLVNSGR